MTITIYHNPKCKTSRDVLKALVAKGIEPNVVEYMKDPPGRTELVRLLNLLRLSPKDIMREKESRQLGLDRNSIELNTALATLAKNPELIERPIIVTPSAARICSTPESVDELINASMAFA